LNFNIKKYRIPLFLIGLCIAIILGGKETNYWGLVDESGEQILRKIELQAVESYQIELTDKQFKDIDQLISNNPENYSRIQKSLISKETGNDILEKVRLGTVEVNSIFLNQTQYQEIKRLIEENPNAYSDNQKLLVKEKSGKEILREVGLGLKKSFNIKLSQKQHDEVRQLLLSNPKKYSITQQELIPEIQDELKRLSMIDKEPIVLEMSSEEILEEVGFGNYSPSEIELTQTQLNEIKKILKDNPTKYNKVQKSLVN
jgi:hypothetical protein